MHSDELLESLSMAQCGVDAETREHLERVQYPTARVVEIGLFDLQRAEPDVPPDPRHVEAAAIVALTMPQIAMATLANADLDDLLQGIHTVSGPYSGVVLGVAARARALYDYPELIRPTTQADAFHLAHLKDQYRDLQAEALIEYREAIEAVVHGGELELPLHVVVASECLRLMLQQQREVRSPDTVRRIGVALGSVFDAAVRVLTWQMSNPASLAAQMSAKCIYNALVVTGAVFAAWADGTLEWQPLPGIDYEIDRGKEALPRWVH